MIDFAYVNSVFHISVCLQQETFITFLINNDTNLILAEQILVGPVSIKSMSIK